MTPNQLPPLSDEQIDIVFEKMIGYVLLPKDARKAARAILALRPQAVPMTPDHIWANDGIMSANGIIGFKFDAVIRIVRAVEAHHGITAKAEGGA